MDGHAVSSVPTIKLLDGLMKASVADYMNDHGHWTLTFAEAVLGCWVYPFAVRKSAHTGGLGGWVGADLVEGVLRVVLASYLVCSLVCDGGARSRSAIHCTQGVSLMLVIE